MAVSQQFIDSPKDTVIMSAYEPIKFTTRLTGSGLEDYKSVQFIITPRDSRTNEYEYENQSTIRVQPSPRIHNWGDDATPNDGVSYKYFSLDISSICRDYLSFDLRACTHDTTTKVQRDITQSMPSYHMFKEFSVRMRPEFVNSSGRLATDSDLDIVDNIFVANVALSDEEQHSLVLSNAMIGSSSAEEQNNSLSKAFTFSAENATQRARCLTLKPNYKIIGTDECEYLTAIMDNGDGENYPYAQIRFFLKGGGGLTNGQGVTLALNLNFSAAGNGTYSSSGGVYHWGGSPSDNDFNANKPEFAVFQLGVGTRNIKESVVGWTNTTADGVPKIGDWHNIEYYTVKFLTSNESREIGQTLYYYIDHRSEDRKYFGESVRFHWQNRLGGIDSYTFDGSATEGINVSSKTYEQTIYPDFQSQLSGNDTNHNFWNGNIPNFKSNYGALVPRVGGLTSDEYRGVSKSVVKAFREGQAVSRPYPRKEQAMMEDLLSSPNVWVERGWRGKEVFRDNFDSLTALQADWTTFSSTNVVEDAADDTITTTNGHIAGSGAYRKGNNNNSDDVDELWAIAKAKKFPYDPNKIYEVEVRIKVASQSADAKNYVGLAGIAADGTTLVNANGVDSHTSQHYITLSGYNQETDDEWEVHRGYITGRLSAGSTTESFQGQSNDPKDPANAHENVEFFAPIVVLNFENEAGRSYVDYIVVREYVSDLPTTSGWYSTLNRYYYVPVNIKDATTTSFDSENQSTMTVNYVESKEKRTIK
jgi:hypothetical protein|tara:strand:+ start:4642 stop:6918 length:2277 start_codon:yes stop_codon:yes gene_type:complete